MDYKIIHIIFIIFILFTITSVNAEEIEDNNDLNLFSNDIETVEDDLKETTGSFTELQQEINNAEDTLNLTRNYTYVNDESSIMINKSLTINGNGHSIDALGKIRIMQVNAEHVTINNITFKNGYDNYRMANSAGIYWLGSYGNIKNCIFDSNQLTGRIADGAAICFNGNAVHDIVIENSVFKNNKATDKGGAIFFTGDNYLIKDCLFENNSVVRLLDDNAKRNAIGGAICIEGNALNRKIINSRFINNSVNALESKRIGHGGAIYIESNVDIFDCLFINNSAKELDDKSRGGSIYSKYSFNLYNSTIINGSSTYGAAIEISGSTNSKSKIYNCNFTNNKAKILGGAIHSQECEFEIKNSRFINNSAGNQGGAFSNWNGKSIFELCTFQNNNAVSGGAIYRSYHHYGETIVESSRFINNTAENGGAIFSEVTLTVNDSEFAENTASENGAGICFDWVSANLHINSSKFTNNHANEGGAVYYWSYTLCEIFKSSFNNNTADSRGGGVFVGLYNFTTSKNITITECNFTNNKGEYGGGIYSYTGINRYVSDSRFINNSASQEGGAILWYSSEKENNQNIIDNSYFERNTAKLGGSILWESANGTLSNCQYVLNKAQIGSAIYIYVGSLDITDSIFLKNQAASNMINCSDYNETHFASTFEGCDNIINAVYNYNQKVTFKNVTYWGVNGEMNSGLTKVKPVIGYVNSNNGEILYQDVHEANIKIVFEIYDMNNNLVKTIHAYTGIDGVANADVTDLNPGNYTVKAIHYSDDYYTQITSNTDSFTIHKDGTKIISKDLNEKVLSEINITETVLDENNNKVQNGTAILTFNGVNYTAEVRNGIVTFTDVNLTKVGNFISKITYKGNDYYNASTGNVNITVSKIHTHTYDHNITHISPHEIIVVVTVTDEYDQLLKNGTVELIIIYENTTESLLGASSNNDVENKHSYFANINNGKAIFDIVLPKLGDYLIDAEYHGSNIYYASEDEVEIDIEKENTTINANDISGKVGEVKTVMAKITDQDGNPVYDGTAKLIIGDAEYNVDVVNGTAIFKNVVLPKKNMTGIIYYIGDDNYTKSNTTIKITVFTSNNQTTTNSTENTTNNTNNIKDTLPVNNNNINNSEHEKEDSLINNTKNTTGNPILLILLVLITIICTSNLKRRK